MKKIIISILIILLVGCSKENVYKTSIICPSGGPSISLLSIIDNSDYEIDIVDGAEVLQAEFVKGDKDIIIAPINLGVNLSKKTSNYKLAYVVTTSNLYLLSNADSIHTIAAFGEEAVPGRIIKYVLSKTPEDKIDYYASVNEAVSAYLNGGYDAVIAAYPVVNKIKSKINDIRIVNLLDYYREVSGYENYPQAALFVSNNYIKNNENQFKEFISDISFSTNRYLNEENSFVEDLEKTDIKSLGFDNVGLIKDSYKELGINIISINDYINETKNFLSLFKIELDDSIIY